MYRAAFCFYETLPGRTPPRRARPNPGIDASIDQVQLAVHVQACAADEPQPRMIEIVVSPFVDRRALRRQPVPHIDVEGKQRGRAAARAPVREIMPPHLSVIVRQPPRITAFDFDSNSSRVFS